MLSGDLYVWLRKEVYVNMCLETLCVCIHIECDSFSSLEHQVCLEAQYYLLKEMAETFPRVKEKQKKEKKKSLREIFYGFQACCY